jgi:hypothetical protein
MRDTIMPGFNSIGLKEVIGVCSWYLWWMRRRRTHDEEVPPINQAMMSILSIVSNHAKAPKPQSSGLVK